MFQVRFLKVNNLEDDGDDEDDVASVDVTELSEDISLKKVAREICKAQPLHQEDS